jgi:hypothetical protein
MHELNRPIAVLALLILSALLGLTAPADATDIPFDAARWKAAAGHYDGRARVLMVDSLRNAHLKDWMTQADVEALLGPPDSRSEKEAGQVGRRHYGYYVGSSYTYVGSHGWGNYYHVFLVSFDPTGRISGRGSIVSSLKD